MLHSAVVDYWSERQNARDGSHTGKRGATRNLNSGLPVDHSGPGLKVEPTAPATADLSSAACPPIFPFASSRLDIFQHKSGRESESGALSGASVASGDLRSEATQRVSSLDKLQNSRNAYCRSEGLTDHSTPTHTGTVGCGGKALRVCSSSRGVRGEAPILTSKGANKC